MSEYKEPIRIGKDDPICSVSSIEGTVIGILFDKTGVQIKEAMAKRITVIDAKIASYEPVIKSVETFIERKEKSIEDIEKIRVDRMDARKAECAPVEREIEKLHKKMSDITRKFDMATDKKIGDKAVDFEKDFDSIEAEFDKVNILIKTDPVLKPVQNQGLLRISGSDCGTSNAYTLTGNVGLGVENPSAMLNVSGTGENIYYTQSDRDRASARIGTLRSLINEYRSKIAILQSLINNLKEEKRRLGLMQRNVDDTRSYKLDLNKLSAFGFEDIENT